MQMTLVGLRDFLGRFSPLECTGMQGTHDIADQESPVTRGRCRLGESLRGGLLATVAAKLLEARA